MMLLLLMVRLLLLQLLMWGVMLHRPVSVGSCQLARAS
jgi:hypothetical protein